MGLRTTFRALFDFLYAADGDYVASFRSGFANPDLVWPNGTAGGQANIPWADIEVSLADGATRNLDLRNLTGPGGVSLTLAEVRLIAVRCRNFPLTFAKGASNGWTALGAAWSIMYPAGSWAYLVCPTDGALPTSASDKVVDISNASGSTATYDLVIIGTAT